MEKVGVDRLAELMQLKSSLQNKKMEKTASVSDMETLVQVETEIQELLSDRSDH